MKRIKIGPRGGGTDPVPLYISNHNQDGGGRSSTEEANGR